MVLIGIIDNNCVTKELHINITLLFAIENRCHLNTFSYILEFIFINKTNEIEYLL